MNAKYIIYNEEKDKFDEFDFDFNWLHVKRCDKISEIECNYYLYMALVKKFYIERNLKYNNELYDNFYHEQFQQIAINN